MKFFTIKKRKKASSDMKEDTVCFKGMVLNINTVNQTGGKQCFGSDGSVINWHSGSAGSIIQDYGSADPDRKKMFTDSEHWW